MRLAIVASRFNEALASKLLERAQAEARLEKGAEAVRVALEMAKLRQRLHEER